MKQTLALLTILLFLFTGLASHGQYIMNIAGDNSSGYGGTGDGGYAWLAGLYRPVSICRDSAGNLYIGERCSSTLQNALVRKITATTGIITTIAGNMTAPLPGDSASGVPATSVRLIGAYGLCFNKTGQLLIADGSNRIRELNLTTGIITTIAGKHTVLGHTGDGGPAIDAALGLPIDVCVDESNNIYILEGYNHTVRKIEAATGVISTIAGIDTAGYNGDGIPATSAKLQNPNGLCVDTAGNIFIADSYNDRVRMINALTGIITTIAGTGIAGSGGDGGPATAAQVNKPTRLAFDRHGNLFITEGNRIRKIAVGTGIITTYAGTGIVAGLNDTAGNNGPATNASIVSYGLCFDPCDDLFMGGFGTHVRAIVPVLPGSEGGALCGFKYNEELAIPKSGSNSEDELQLHPNPNDGRFILHLMSSISEPLQITLTDVIGRQITLISGTTNKDIELLLNNPPGLYFIGVTTNNGKWCRKVTVR